MDFTYNDTTIQSSGGFKPSTKNTPLDVRTVINTYAEMSTIPNPYIGMEVTVINDETNKNRMTKYRVETLKANDLGIENSIINITKRIETYSVDLEELVHITKEEIDEFLLNPILNEDGVAYENQLFQINNLTPLDIGGEYIIKFGSEECNIDAISEEELLFEGLDISTQLYLNLDNTNVANDLYACFKFEGLTTENSTDLYLYKSDTIYVNEDAIPKSYPKEAKVEKLIRKALECLVEYQKKYDDTLATENKTIVEAINELKYAIDSIDVSDGNSSGGEAVSLPFNTIDKGMASNYMDFSEIKSGNYYYIIRGTLGYNVPDGNLILNNDMVYISKSNTTMIVTTLNGNVITYNSGTNGTDYISCVKNNFITSNKVSETYQTKNDENLITTNKEIVGAINEIKNAMDSMDGAFTVLTVSTTYEELDTLPEGKKVYILNGLGVDGDPVHIYKTGSNITITTIDGTVNKYIKSGNAWTSYSTEETATKFYVDDAIANAQLDRGEVDTTSFATDLSLTGSNLQLKNKQGNLIGNAITLPPTSGGVSETVTVVKDVYANNEMPKMYVTSASLGTLAGKADGTADCEVEIRFNRQIIKCYATGAVQGTSSTLLPAKNYTFKFYSDAEHTTKNKIDVGWGKQSKYCFKKNYVDSTHTRNISGARIAYDMVNSRPESNFKNNLLTAPRNGAIDGFPCKIYLNGEFWGLYTWNIPKDAWMFNMNDDNPTHMVLCAEYNNNGDNAQNNTCEFRALWGGESDTNWSIEVGTYSETLKNSFNSAISHVMNSSNEDFKTNFSNYFDLDSMLDYYCFSYLTAHIDGLGKNMLMATYDGVHWGACLYDMDSIYGADWNGASFKSATIKCPEEYQETNSLLWQRIVANFSQELYDRYFELRNSALSLGNIINHVEEIYDLVPDRVFNDDRQKWTGIPSQTTNTITRFRNYMRDRAVYCDERFKELILDKSVTGVSISGNSEVKVGSSITLTANLTPNFANVKTGSWSANNSNVTLNDSNGLSVVVNGSVLGSSAITFTSDDTTNGTISATHDINVIETSSEVPGDYEAELILQPVMAGKTWETHSASTSSDCTGFECISAFTYFDFPTDTSSTDTSYMYCSESIPVVTESEKKTNNIPCVATALVINGTNRQAYITLKLSNSDASNLDQLKTYLTNNITKFKVNMKPEVLKYTFNIDNIEMLSANRSKAGYVFGEFIDNSCPVTTQGTDVASALFMAGLPSNPNWSAAEYSYFKIVDQNSNRYIGFQIAEYLLETQDLDGIKKFISKIPTLFYVV